MRQLDEQGGTGLWIGLFIFTFLLLIGAVAFGVWAYQGRQDYKNNVQPKIDQAVTLAKQQEDTAKDAEFVVKEKQPLKTYNGPATFGSVSIEYPKTWSAFVTTDDSSSPINGYFHPDIVPGVNSGTTFALRLVVLDQSYSQLVQNFTAQAKNGKITISAYRAPKVPSVLGTRVDGAINDGQQDSLVMFPIRDKTVEVFTESQEYLNDFNTNILPNLTFSP